MSWMERAPRAVASTSSDSSTRPRQTTPTRGRPSEVAPAIFPGTKEGAVAIAGVLLHAIAAGHCKGALAGDGHSALILGKSGFYGAEQFLVGGVGGGKAAGGAGRGAGSATDALLRGDDNALFAQGDGTRGAHGGRSAGIPRCGGARARSAGARPQAAVNSSHR